MRVFLVVLAGLAGAAAAALPSLAESQAPSAASFTAIDYAWQATGSGATQATIAQGGTVSFGYPSGASMHNADFGSGPQPSSCTQTAGAAGGSVPPLPSQPSAPGWSGTCTFNAPGTYSFHCDLHPYMTATIVVQGSGTTTTTTGTTTTTTATTTTTGTTTAPPPAGARGSLLVGGPARGISVAASQHGDSVRGLMRVGVAGSGGRLAVDVFASRMALGHVRARGRVRIAGLTRRRVRAGTLRFSVTLHGAARRTLQQRGRLVVTVTLRLQSVGGGSVSATRTVRLNA